MPVMPTISGERAVVLAACSISLASCISSSRFSGDAHEDSSDLLHDESGDISDGSDGSEAPDIEITDPADTSPEDTSGDLIDEEVPLPEDCSSGSKVLYMNGDSDDFISPGIVLIEDDPDWTWDVLLGFIGFTDDVTYIGFDIVHGTYMFPGPWYLDFSTDAIGTPMSVDLYTPAMRWPFMDPGVAGLSISGEGRGCNRLSGWFEVEALVIDTTVDPVELVEFQASFEQHCEELEPVLRGCIRYTR